MSDMTLTIRKYMFAVAGILGLLLFGVPAKAQELHSFHNTDPGGYHFWLYAPEGKSTNPEKNLANTEKDQNKVTPLVQKKKGPFEIEEEEPREQKPLIIFLHGASLCGTNLARVRTYGCLDALARGRKIDAYILAPQCPGGGWKPEKVMKLVEWTSRNHDVDTTRIYVMGMSLGGYGTIDFAATYPDRIAAAMAICGGGGVKNLGDLNRLPLWILHGTADRAVPISASDRVVAEMRKAGKPDRLIYSRLKGYNHGQPAKIFYMPAAYEWLFKHSTKDQGRPVNRDIAITTATISKAYTDLHHRMQMKVYDRTKVKAQSHEDAGYTPDTETATWPDNTLLQTAQEERHDAENVAEKNNSGQAAATYRVKSGDNLYVIARKNRTTVKKLKELNGLKSDNLRIGQKLKLN